MTRLLMMRLLLLIIAIALIVVAVTMPPMGCQQNSDSGLRTVQMQIGRKMFTLEVADTFASRQYGLMHRDSMPSNHGMIFVFAREEPLAFWMKNTRIPLDIIYLDAAGQVVSIRQMKPHDLRTVPSGGPAQYVIELNEGAAAAVGVKAGDKLAIPKQSQTAKANDNTERNDD